MRRLFFFSLFISLCITVSNVSNIIYCHSLTGGQFIELLFCHAFVGYCVMWLVVNKWMMTTTKSSTVGYRWEIAILRHMLTRKIRGEWPTDVEKLSATPAGHRRCCLRTYNERHTKQFNIIIIQTHSAVLMAVPKSTSVLTNMSFYSDAA